MSDSHVPSKEKVCRHMGIPIDREDCNICAREDLAAARANVERLQRAVTSAMDRLSNGDTESGARILRECFWGTAPEPPPARIGPDTPDNSMVICPTCTSQFVAIPVDVQRQLADLSVAYDCATQTNIAQSAKLRAVHESPAPVCPINDRECGDHRELWCGDCPKRHAAEPASNALARPRRGEFASGATGDAAFNAAICTWQYDEIGSLQQDLQRAKDANAMWAAQSAHEPPVPPTKLEQFVRDVFEELATRNVYFDKHMTEAAINAARAAQPQQAELIAGYETRIADLARQVDLLLGEDGIKKLSEHLAVADRAAQPPLVFGDAIEWRGHRGKVLAADVVHVKLEKGSTHFLHAKDLQRATLTKEGK